MNGTMFYQANPNFILRTIAEAKVLVAVGAGVADFRGYIQMNPSAEKIWETLQNKVSAADIVDALYEAFDATREDLAKDVEETLAVLAAKGMVTVYDA